MSGRAWRGAARLGSAGLGRARQGPKGITNDLTIFSRRGKARRGTARLGRDRRGMDRQGRHGRIGTDNQGMAGRPEGQRNMYNELKVRLTGVAPLLMHNGDLADPLNQWSKASKKITSKPAKQKTDRDTEEISRIDFMGGLYLDEKLEPCLPGEVIEAWVRSGARSQRKGKDAEGGLYCDGNFPLKYKGPRDPDKMWEDKSFVDRRGVKVGQARVMRTRPIFKDWSCDIVINFDNDYMNKEQLLEFLDDAGRKGICDHRPRFGRCTVEVIK